MQTVTVKKEELLKTLKENCSKHNEKFKVALDGYRKVVLAVLERAIAETRGCGKVRTSFSIPCPEDHTAAYKRAIEMLKWSVDDEIEIGGRDFRKFVLDEWVWTHEFKKNHVFYSSCSVSSSHSSSSISKAVSDIFEEDGDDDEFDDGDY